MSKERNYWNKEMCMIESKKYTKKSEFQKFSKGAYESARKNKWLDEICAHMIKIKPKYFWNKDRCEQEAKKFLTKKDFRKNSPGAYNSSKTNGWLDEICQHMIHKKKNASGYWTLHRCIEEAKKYKTRKEFINHSYVCYQVSLKNNWIDIVCNELPGWRPKNFWTKESCADEAKKYKTRVEFEKYSSSAYQKSIRMGWMDEICQHMRKVGNHHKRCIYAIEFEDNHAYIGLTYDVEKRFELHKNLNRRSSVSEHIIKTKLEPKIKILTDYIDVEDASKMEEFYKNKYLQNDWIVLNKVKCGATGSSKLFWNLERCKAEFTKYETKNEFRKKSPGAYNIINL